jgi:hypothetical protein
VARHRDDGKKFLNTLDAARTALQQLLVPEVGIAGIDKQLRERAWGQRESQERRAHVLCIEQRDDVRHIGHVAQQLLALDRRIALNRLLILIQRAGAVHRGLDAVLVDVEYARQPAAAALLVGGDLRADRLVHRRCALADCERVGFALEDLVPDHAGLDHAASNRRGGVEVWTDAARFERLGGNADVEHNMQYR